MRGKRPSDRDLLKIARMNATAAGRDLTETDEVWVNHALFNVTQAAEKIIKFLCSDQDIDYDFSHNVVSLIDRLLEKGSQSQSRYRTTRGSIIIGLPVPAIRPASLYSAVL